MMYAEAANPQITSRAAGDSAGRKEACRASVRSLRALLDTLFPEDPSPDLITVEDILKRYRLTGLGAPATSAIEQAQRIARARGDYSQSGLCEFHIGLIFLYFGDSRAAVNQFMAARNQWTLAGDSPANCLARYAQGVGLAHSFRYEAAMTQFGRAEKGLSRLPLGRNGERMANLGDILRPALADSRDEVRQRLWPEEPEASEVLAEDQPVTARTTSRSTVPVDSQPNAPASQEVNQPSAEAAPAPVVSGERSPIAAEQAAERPRVAAPISRLAAPQPATTEPLDRGAIAGPVPGHQQQDSRYTWYVVHKRHDSWLPDLTEGTLLLVDSDPRQPLLGAGDLVVLGSAQPEASSVILRPQSTPVSQPYCFLVRPAEDGQPLHTAGTSRFMSTESGQAAVFDEALVLGVVVGSWHPMLG